jgi:hypothetical protein
MLKLGGPLFGGLLSTPYASAHLTANCAGKRVREKTKEDKYFSQTFGNLLLGTNKKLYGLIQQVDKMT